MIFRTEFALHSADKAQSANATTATFQAVALSDKHRYSVVFTHPLLSVDFQLSAKVNQSNGSS